MGGVCWEGEGWGALSSVFTLFSVTQQEEAIYPIS